MPLTASTTSYGDAPRLIAASPQGTSHVLLTFSENMSSTGLTTAGNYTLVADGGSTARTVTAVQQLSGTQVLLTLSGALTAGTDNYAVTAAAITDSIGNVIDPLYDTLDISGPAPNGSLYIGKDGGAASFTAAVADGTYRVFVGPLGTTADPELFGGTSGLTGVRFVGGSTTAYLPAQNTGGPYTMTFLPEVGPAFAEGPAVTILPASFRSRTLQLRTVLPPWFKTGPRSLDAVRFPQ